MDDTDTVSRKEKTDALINIIRFRPVTAIAVAIGGVFVALMEGVGIGFILPIVELVQSSGDPTQQADGALLAFVSVYEFFGIPFTLGSVIVGVSLVLSVRWTSTFFIRFLSERMRYNYIKKLQTDSFQHALNAKIEYFDREGSDDILNAIVTQAAKAGNTITHVISFLEQSLISLVYAAVALAIAPVLTVGALVFLGATTVLFRYIIEPGYELGDEVADANENIQEVAQMGTQGIRDVKMYDVQPELSADFFEYATDYATTRIKIGQHSIALNTFYNLLVSISVFVLIYIALTFADMSFGALSVFLFTMFRLGPKVSNLNSIFYRTENHLPHLVRTQQFIDELSDNSEPTASEPAPSTVRTIEFDNVRFAYAGQDDTALDGLSFSFEKGEFIGFVGQSGAGKSTVVSLLARMYEPDEGEILANDESIHEMDITDWRSQVAIVRQDPFIFNESLRYNLTVGNRDVEESELDRVCDIAKVTEFLDELPERYDTYLGDEGVRLSGGQRQRVALARALLKDAEILILDEATSDLDSNLEKQVQESIEQMDRDYAIVGIAHRLSTVQNADRIYTVESGEITETGSHEELLAKGETYAELYSIQSEA
jgi:subfamily B ATP-binding cassette protein MsbA